jgi:hypothetical protein
VWGCTKKNTNAAAAMISHVISGRVTPGFASRIGIKRPLLSWWSVIMPAMDDTHVAELLAELQDADPAEAAEIAERLAQLLANHLEMDEEPST